MPPDATRPAPRTLARKVKLLLLVNLVLFATTALLAEAGVRLFWQPRFWVHGEGLILGSGQDAAGRKWWPDSTFRIEGREFRVRFRSDARGYRARPEPPRTADPCRVAFVGDSFTEAMQVEYDQSFVALLERELAGRDGGREVVAENYGVAATGFFDYWHRIIHDVFRPGASPPDALVLCIFPDNDFTDHCPDAGFAPDGRPRREYFRPPGRSRHVLAWLSLKSKLAYLALHSLHIAVAATGHPQLDAPPLWWNDPALAAASADAPGVRRIRSLMRAIADECDRHGTRLVVLVLPAREYAGSGGRSPLTQIFGAWGIKAPVLDVGAAAKTSPNPSRLVFPLDGHLNPTGHRFVADQALEPLAQALATDPADRR